MPLNLYLSKKRLKFVLDEGHTQLRLVHISDIAKVNNKGEDLSKMLSDRAPLFYRNVDKIIESLKDGFLLTPVAETLAKLPTSEHFQSSHFGEIVSSIFLNDVIGWKRLYSKLCQNTSENQNAFKMDIVCYDPASDPLNIIFCEVKSSPRDATDGMPPKHHESCYADIFNSLREYEERDLRFDLTSLKDNLQIFDPSERERIRTALKPYHEHLRVITYVGIAVIDRATYLTDEVPVLAKRKSLKTFDVELLCLESYKEISKKVFDHLESIRQKLA